MATASNVLLLILVSLSAAFDAKERRIPNKITFMGVVVGLLFNLINGGWIGLLNSFLGLLAGIAIFFIPFAVGGMGAGDVKLMGAIGALMGWRFSMETAIYSALVGGVMVLVFLLYTGKMRDTLIWMLMALVQLLNRIIQKRGYSETLMKAEQTFYRNGQEYKKIYIPYGVAIAGGAVLVLLAYSQGIQVF
ncbi:prepilin peptidase [Trichococcus sp. K1Tr]|uniref:A24 family peptidase n=1 Tax=Trichococcus sp. K1Tr TaxID=3020847 RepID=UPI002330BFA6|nr:prepilin peptidase [Trichococcus sp. K1Tr]MDB6353955.1 prepilin peptidase [Trichococcus sp. K1Tr]